jgi:glycosyltransferase involved in cell wall biosynthesis
MKTTPSIVSIDCTQGLVLAKATSGIERKTYAPNVRRDGEIFRAAKLVIATSKWAALSLHREYPDCDTEVVVMPSPVQLAYFDRAWIAERLARFEQNPGARPRVLFVGGDFQRKGGYDLLRVWREGHFGNRADLDLVTSWPIEGTRLSAGVSVHRDVHGFTGPWRRLWREADIFVLPTHDEAFGTVFQEAAAAGLPAVGTSINAVPELIENGATGLIVAPRSIDDLARALDTLIASAELRRTMGEQARTMVEWSADPREYQDTLINALEAVAGMNTCAA